MQVVRVCACLHACARTTADGLKRACAADAGLLTFKLVFKLNWPAPSIRQTCIATTSE